MGKTTQPSILCVLVVQIHDREILTTREREGSAAALSPADAEKGVWHKWRDGVRSKCGCLTYGSKQEGGIRWKWYRDVWQVAL